MKTMEMNEFRKCLSSRDGFIDFCKLHSSVLYTNVKDVRAGIKTSCGITSYGEARFSFYGIHKLTFHIFIQNESLSTLWSCHSGASILHYSSLPQEAFSKLGKWEKEFFFKNIDVFTLNGFLNE